MELIVSSIQTCSLCPKQVLKILLVILLLTQRQKIFKPIRAIDIFGTN